MKTVYRLLAILMVFSLLLSACSAATQPPAAATDAPAAAGDAAAGEKIELVV